MLKYKISKLKVSNFRNLDCEQIIFSPNINCIFGENGNGKTNILEAIFVLMTGKSFKKNTSFPQLLSMDCGKPEILFSSIFQDEVSDNTLSYSLKLENKLSLIYLDGEKSKKRPNLSVVFINPFDSYNFYYTPSFKRNWFDTHIGIIDKVYRKNVNKHQKSIKFRNILLTKKTPKYREQIEAIDVEIAKLSKEITSRRIEFLSSIQDYLQDTFKQIFSQDLHLSIHLESKFIDYSETQILEYFKKSLPKDEILCHTGYGIHKDDYVLQVNGFNAYDYCSLGQQKMSYLCLLFAYIELFRYKLNTYPVVLIDDVSGELDEFRWQLLIDYLSKCQFQVLITTANEKFRDQLEKINDVNKILVISGEVTNL